MPLDGSLSENDMSVCPKCDADQIEATNVCWLCGSSLEGVQEFEETARPTRRPERFSYSLSTLMLIVTLVAVCCGLLIVAPGLAVPMCVLLVPVLVRTTMVVRRREEVGLPVSPTEKVSLVLSSLSVATLLCIVVCSAAFASFCGVCLLIVSADQRYGGAGMVAWGIGMCAAAAVAVIAMVRIIKWIAARYRRDVQG